jgi:hypothetical protein
MPLVTPPINRPLFGKVQRIHRIDLIEVDFDLGHGVHIYKKIGLDGIPQTAGSRFEDAADHCAVILLGSKNVVGVSDARGRLRLLLNERVYDPPEGTTVSDTPGLNATLVDVSHYLAHIISTGCEVTRVKALLNGRAGK